MNSEESLRLGLRHLEMLDAFKASEEVEIPAPETEDVLPKVFEILKPPSR